MIILALDSSGPSAGVALMRDEIMIYESTVTNKLTHSVNLMPMVEEALIRSNLNLSEVDVFAAVVGPGSFTGVRIAVSAVQGMAQALGKQCVGVNALDALALGAVESQALICPIRDARVNQVYGAAFFQGKRVMEDAVLKLPDYLEIVKDRYEKLYFVGDGVTAYQKEIAANLGSRAVFAPPHLNDLKAGAAVMIAAHSLNSSVAPQDLLPLYLRQPQAQRELEKRNG